MSQLFSMHFSGFMQDDKILAYTQDGVQLVGYTAKYVAKVQKDLDDTASYAKEYEARLIELGEIEVELTPDQLIAQQAEQLKIVTAALADAQKAQAESNTIMQQMLTQMQQFSQGLGTNNGNTPDDSKQCVKAAAEPATSGDGGGNNSKGVQGPAGGYPKGFSQDKHKPGAPKASPAPT